MRLWSLCSISIRFCWHYVARDSISGSGRSLLLPIPRRGRRAVGSSPTFSSSPYSFPNLKPHSPSCGSRSSIWDWRRGGRSPARLLKGAASAWLASLALTRESERRARPSRQSCTHSLALALVSGQAGRPAERTERERESLSFSTNAARGQQAVNGFGRVPSQTRSAAAEGKRRRPPPCSSLVGVARGRRAVLNG